MEVPQTVAAAITGSFSSKVAILIVINEVQKPRK